MSSPSPARACAYTVIRRVFEQGAYADRALSAEAAGLEPRERSLAMALSFGTVQRRATLDHVAARLSSRPPQSLDAPVLAALRLGLFQILFLDGIADHAAVNESVELAKRDARGGAGLVNAVLRRATVDGPSILGGLDDRSPEAAAVLHSVPTWLASLWWEELGAERARELLRTITRMGVTCASVLVADAGSPGLGGSFDRVLLDPPCSGLGTLQSRPDLRWRTSPERIVELKRVQAKILDSAAARTAPGGVLVYSVCTITAAEGELQIDAFLERHIEFAADNLPAEFADRGPGAHLQLMPDRDGTDGFFIARVRRR